MSSECYKPSMTFSGIDKCKLSDVTISNFDGIHPNWWRDGTGKLGSLCHVGRQWADIKFHLVTYVDVLYHLGNDETWQEFENATAEGRMLWIQSNKCDFFQMCRIAKFYNSRIGKYTEKIFEILLDCSTNILKVTLFLR